VRALTSEIIMTKYGLGAILVLLTFTNAGATEILWGFKNPAFHYGNGYSTHVLSVEQLQYNRKKEIADFQRSEALRIERELENTTLNKFLKNLESRIYAQISKQMVDSMFSSCDDAAAAAGTCTQATTGTATIEGSTITWIRDPLTGSITLQILNEDGTYTEITIPGSGEFGF